MTEALKGGFGDKGISFESLSSVEFAGNIIPVETYLQEEEPMDQQKKWKQFRQSKWSKFFFIRRRTDFKRNRFQHKKG